MVEYLVLSSGSHIGWILSWWPAFVTANSDRWTEVQSFIGFINFYQQFIQGCSHIAKPYPAHKKERPGDGQG